MGCLPGMCSPGWKGPPAAWTPLGHAMQDCSPQLVKLLGHLRPQLGISCQEDLQTSGCFAKLEGEALFLHGCRASPHSALHSFVLRRTVALDKARPASGLEMLPTE